MLPNLGVLALVPPLVEPEAGRRGCATAAPNANSDGTEMEYDSDATEGEEGAPALPDPPGREDEQGARGEAAARAEAEPGPRAVGGAGRVSRYGVDPRPASGEVDGMNEQPKEEAGPSGEVADDGGERGGAGLVFEVQSDSDDEGGTDRGDRGGPSTSGGVAADSSAPPADAAPPGFQKRKRALPASITKVPRQSNRWRKTAASHPFLNDTRGIGFIYKLFVKEANESIHNPDNIAPLVKKHAKRIYHRVMNEVGGGKDPDKVIEWTRLFFDGNSFKDLFFYSIKRFVQVARQRVLDAGRDVEGRKEMTEPFLSAVQDLLMLIFTGNKRDKPEDPKEYVERNAETIREMHDERMDYPAPFSTPDDANEFFTRRLAGGGKRREVKITVLGKGRRSSSSEEDE